MFVQCIMMQHTLVAQRIEDSDLDFSTYGDTFFEVVFVGGFMQSGRTKSDIQYKHPYSILGCEPRGEDILPFVTYLQNIFLGKVEDKLLDFLPLAMRTLQAFSEHFTKGELLPLVEDNWKRIIGKEVMEIKYVLMDPMPKEEISVPIGTVRQHLKDAKQEDEEVVRILWNALMDDVQWPRDQQQSADRPFTR